MVAKLIKNSPRASASFFSKLFFTWLHPLFLKGWKKDLVYEDLYETLEEDSSKVLGERLISEWKKEVERSVLGNKEKPEEKALKADVQISPNTNNSYRPSLLKALIRIFWIRWAFIGIFLFVEECIAKIAQPLFLGYLLRYFNGEYDTSSGYLFAIGVIVSVMYYTTSHHPSFFSIIHLNLKIRVACSSLLYDKTLRLSQMALSKTTSGQVVNLLANDISRFDFCLNFVHYLWIGPVQLMISVFILWSYFGFSCLAGVVFLILFTPFQSLMGHLFSKLRLKVAGKTDKRVRIMNEILNGIRVIKTFAFEIPFSKIVSKSREDEIHSIGKQMTLRGVNLGLYYVSSKIIIFLTLVAYVLAGNYLGVEKVFVTMALYQNVRLLMTIFFPWGISFLAETKVSINRIENFLLLQDYIPINNNKSTNKTNNEDWVKLVSVKNVSAKWDESSPENTLNNISLTASEGNLVMIIGPVASGKSSLLQTILGELPLSAGEINIDGSIGYVGQEAFIVSGSVRENILFGKSYNPSWYQKVVDACSLRTDLAAMTRGDKTFIGDKSLSGGQKARINLARAVYSNADIFIFDDILSALDAEVAKQIFEKCICGLLRNKIKILVTHSLQFLSKANEIILMSNGSVVAQGTYSSLQKRDINFAQILNAETEDMIEDNTGPEARRASVNSSYRTGSFGSTSSIGKRHRKESVKSVEEELIEREEEVGSGSIKASTYWKYLRVGSNLCQLGFILFSNITTQILYSGSDFWLRYWIESEEHNEKTLALNNTLIFMTNETEQETNTSSWEASENEIISPRMQQIWIYSFLITALFIMTLIRTIGFFKICMRSSVALHLQLFHGVLRAPMSFFETNPIGLLLNRFTKDIGVIDELLPFTLFDTLEVGLQVVGVIGVVCIINPIFTIPSALIAVLFYYIRIFYQKTARHLKRLEGAARGPVYNHLSSTLNGLTMIRAFKTEDHFRKHFNANMDLHTAIFYLFNASARWLGIVVDWISILYISAVTLGVVALKLDGSAAGLAISSAMSLTSWFQWGVRQSAEAENQMVSVERVIEYASGIESEAPFESFPEHKPPNDWPKSGEIQFQNLCVKYMGNVPFLENLNFTIHALEKVGIVGRTGAGKTTLISALFRLTEPSSGRITIDGINVLEIGLHDLRRKISIIPQEPILFLGSLRYNLDPFQEFEDSEIWSALQEVHLYDTVKKSTHGLDGNINEGGQNLSLGERQLLCLGRAILRKNKILVMDEATASCDAETDALIQKSVRTNFANCTVLTVAHRLHTIIDCDRVIVMDAGTIAEFDEPHLLLKNKNGIFYHLVQETGPETSAELTAKAEEAAIRRKGKLDTK